MKLTEHYLAELDREARRSRRAFEQVPDGKYDWKPHDKSMAFGYLTEMIATMPSWIAFMIDQNELDLNPASGSQYKPTPMRTSAELLKGLEASVAKGRKALQSTNDEFLNTNWRLLVAGNTVAEGPRHVMMRDLMNHMAHHRGQMTVYLRLMGATVPALYGPSADDKQFA